MCRLVIDVANKTNDTAGDGTTTATVLARAIYSEGVRNVAAGCNPMDLRRGTQKAVDQVISFMEKSKRVITTSDQIAQVFTSSKGNYIISMTFLLGRNYLCQW